MPALTIIDTPIRQDDAGRYCLNDLHKASGGEQRHRPKYFIGNKQTKALIAELPMEHSKVDGTPITFRGGIPPLGIAGIPAISAAAIGGIPPVSMTQKLGTFVVKELVYAYAMWISPAFTLKVIRAYDALVSGEIRSYRHKVNAAERIYFRRYPERRTIREMALKGEPYWYIGRMVRRTSGTVGKAIRDMVERAMIDANALRIARIGMGILWAHRRKYAQQLAFAGF
jgi:hypothetical protein